MSREDQSREEANFAPVSRRERILRALAARPPCPTPKPGAQNGEKTGCPRSSRRPSCPGTSASGISVRTRGVPLGRRSAFGDLLGAAARRAARPATRAPPSTPPWQLPTPLSSCRPPNGTTITCSRDTQPDRSDSRRERCIDRKSPGLRRGSTWTRPSLVLAGQAVFAGLNRCWRSSRPERLRTRDTIRGLAGNERSADEESLSPAPGLLARGDHGPSRVLEVNMVEGHDLAHDRRERPISVDF